MNQADQDNSNSILTSATASWWILWRNGKDALLVSGRIQAGSRLGKFLLLIDYQEVSLFEIASTTSNGLVVGAAEDRNFLADLMLAEQLLPLASRHLIVYHR